MGAGHHRTLRLATAVTALGLLAGCGGGGGTAAPVAPVDAPVDVTNRWSVVPPAREGIDAGALAAADRAARDGGDVTALLVARRGRLVLERYYGGASPRYRSAVHSIAKAVVAALVGAAVRDGSIPSVERPVLDYFPEVEPLVVDERVQRITLRHLLTMSAGWVVEGETPTSGSDVLAAPDPALAAFGRPLFASPGDRFGYDNGASHLLSLVITQATGVSTAEFARRKLFRPLGIANAYWEEDPNGTALGATGLYLTARDLAKLGQLLLQSGRWGSRQLLPAAYVRDATRPQIAVGLTDEGYGYQLYVSRSAERNYAAVGAGGQSVTVFPKQQAVVVVTSRPGKDSEREAVDLIYEFIAPAIGAGN